MIELKAEKLNSAKSALINLRGAYEKAVAFSVNRAADGMRTDAARETAAKYFVKQSVIREVALFRKASFGSLISSIIFKGSRKKISEYKVKKGKPGNITVAVKKEGGMKAFPNAFVSEKDNAFYMREGEKVRKIMSPSIPQIVKNRDTVAAMEKGATRRFEKTLDHEVLRRMGVFG